MRTPLTLVVALAAGSSLVVPAACSPGDPGNAGECSAAADCGASETTCAGCPELPSELCVEGECISRGEDVVDVRADVSLHRDVAAEVRSFVHVLAGAVSATGPLSCADALEDGQVGAGVNVLAAGFKGVEGGSFHDDVNVGRAPAGELLLVIIATSENAGQGDVLATGCLDGLRAEAATPTLDAGLVQVAP